MGCHPPDGIVGSISPTLAFAAATATTRAPVVVVDVGGRDAPTYMERRGGADDVKDRANRAMASLRSSLTHTTALSHGGWRGSPLGATSRGDNNDLFDEVGDLGGAREEGNDDGEFDWRFYLADDNMGVDDGTGHGRFLFESDRTRASKAEAPRNVDDGGNDIHDLSPDVNVVGLTGDDDDENATATPGRYDCRTMGGCGSDRCSGQSICKERGRVKRKEEEASSKEHDERRNNGAPPQRHEIEINGVKHACPHFEFDPNNQNVEKKCALMVDGKKMFVDFHDLTKKDRGRDGSRPRLILGLSLPGIPSILYPTRSHHSRCWGYESFEGSSRQWKY